MLSQRAKTTIKIMGKCWARGVSMGGWSWSGGFELIPHLEVREDLRAAKADGLLKGVGATTINEIVCFHKTLIDIWPET